MIDEVDIDMISLSDSLKDEIKRYNIFQTQLLNKETRDLVEAKKINLRNYMKYMIANWSKDEKREVLSMVQAKIILKDKKIYIEK